MGALRRMRPPLYLVIGLLFETHAEDSTARVALTTSVSEAMAKAYAGSSASAWAKPGAPPSSTAWKSSARTKYLATELAAANYLKLDDLDKRFRDVTLALAMDWEIFASTTYALLQAAYESVHPWRTGTIVRANWTVAQGDRFAALTSSVGDVLLCELTKKALLEGQAWPNFGRSLWFGQYQEVVAEQKLTQKDWQLYTCDEQRNPIIIQHNATNPAVHFIPSLTWITMPLDVATFVGDVLAGDSRVRWAAYEKRGAALWEEYRTVHSPVVRDILQKLGGDSEQEVERSSAPSGVHSSPAPPTPKPSPDDLIVAAQAAIDLATHEYNATAGSISASTYGFIRSIYMSVGIVSNTTAPALPTCAGTENAHVYAPVLV